MCLSHSGIGLEVCSVRLRGGGLTGKLSAARKVGRWKPDEQRTITECRGDSTVGSRP